VASFVAGRDGAVRQRGPCRPTGPLRPGLFPQAVTLSIVHQNVAIVTQQPINPLLKVAVVLSRCIDPVQLLHAFHFNVRVGFLNAPIRFLGPLDAIYLVVLDILLGEQIQGPVLWVQGPQRVDHEAIPDWLQEDFLDGGGVEPVLAGRLH
jgi:hypothetical protein